ncbi:MAG: DUF5916 domain-containing protein [Bacteroidales bacterium]
MPNPSKTSFATARYRRFAVAMLLCFFAGVIVAAAQTPDASAAPSLKVGRLASDLRIDGKLDEPGWQHADAIENLTMLEPKQGGTPTGRTIVKVLADARGIVFGVVCEDPDPARIVSYTKQRDGDMSAEDHIEIVLDTFLDGRSGYVFWVNPGGARYDALINAGGGDVNSNWDGIWEAATTRTDTGWTAEIRIPLHTLSFKQGSTSWHFNIQRRIQRLQETDRWATPRRDYKITQMSRAGLLTDLPAFELGLGMTVRPSVVGGGGIPAPHATFEGDRNVGVDVTQRLGSNLLGSASVNTDFAETEVDTRQTNLTRFSLFFPEKRAFFLEGSDIFQFGVGLDETVVPFFSRTIGLVNGQQVPIAVAGKLNGRVGDTNVGAVVAQTKSVDGVAPSAAMGAFRIKQNVFGESSVGAVATFGDPTGKSGSWLAGTDFTYQTSHFRKDKNFLVDVWGLGMGQAGTTGDKTAAGFEVGYPNDLWNVALSYSRIGDAFQPSLGYVQRPATQTFSLVGEYDPRPNFWHIRQMFNEFEFIAWTDLAGKWQSYRIFLAPINWRFESGDRVEVNYRPTGEYLTEPFEIAPGVVIPPGPYNFTRYRLEAGSAAKRKLSGQATWWFGTFYDGTLDQFLLTASWNPAPLLTVSFSGERDIGRLKEGTFVTTLVGTRARLNISPDLTVSSFVQYDTDSRSVGTNTRLRWTFRPAGDLFVIYNHNLVDVTDRWRFDSNQLLVKLQYSFRY